MTARLLLILGVVLAAAAILFSGRYQLVGSESGVYRLDRMTGSVQMCLPKKDHPFSLNCSGEVDDWVSAPKK